MFKKPTKDELLGFKNYLATELESLNKQRDELVTGKEKILGDPLLQFHASDMTNKLMSSLSDEAVKSVDAKIKVINEELEKVNVKLAEFD